MKYKLLVLIALTIVSLTAKSQVIVSGCIITMKESKDHRLVFQNDSVLVSFTPSSTFWWVKITNKLKQETMLSWDKSSFIVNGKSSKIIFDNTINLNKNDALPSQVIPSESYIEKNIFPVESLELALPVISKRFATKRFKETGDPDSVRIILAMEINGKPNVLAFNFYVTPVKKY
jgi:hypothetical protein